MIERAIREHVPLFVFNPKQYETKQQFEREILKQLQQKEIEWIVLAGYMRLIGSTLLQAYPNKIVNIHPSLLPAFPGKDAIGQAYRYGVKVTGVTVHYVDEGMDTGPIIAQQALYIYDGEPLESVERRIHDIEHTLYPQVIQQLLTEKGSTNHEKRAIISVSNKKGIVTFAKQLVELGVEIISTGGTKRVLAEHGIPVVSISDVTNFPEILDGRVKTLHPNIHGGLLAVRDDETHKNSCKTMPLRQSTLLLSIYIHSKKRSQSQTCRLWKRLKISILAVRLCCGQRQKPCLCHSCRRSY